MHVLHIAALCGIGLMTVFAVTSAATTWTHAEAVFETKTITADYTLWGYKTTETGGPTHEGSWADMLDNDKMACEGEGGTASNRDLLRKYRVAQAGAILSILGSTAFGVLGLVYGLEKLSKKLLLLIPAIVTFAFAMMAYGSYTSAFNACKLNSCEAFRVFTVLGGAKSTECGPAAGVFLVWAACALGLAAFCMFMARNAGAVVVPVAAVPVAADGSVNTTAYQAFPAQGQHPAQLQYAYQAYPAQQQQQQYQPYPPQCQEMCLAQPYPQGQLVEHDGSFHPTQTPAYR